MKTKKKVNLLFVCTGNAARSQIAEGLTKKYGTDKVEVKSAGIIPVGVHKYVPVVMKEIGVDIKNPHSKKITPSLIKEADYVIILCGYAKSQCPPIPFGTKKLFWPMPDPYSSIGTEEEVIGCFRHVRDLIKEKLVKFIDTL